MPVVLRAKVPTRKRKKTAFCIHTCYLCTTSVLPLYSSQLALPAVDAPLDGVPLLRGAAAVRVEAGGDGVVIQNGDRTILTVCEGFIGCLGPPGGFKRP